VKTPRTDAERRVLKKAKSYPVDPVSAEFARQLERELATMTALADRLAETLSELMAMRHKCFIPNEGDWWDNKASAALAAYEKPDQQIKQPCDCIEKCGKYWIQRCDCQNDTSLAEAQSWCDHENHKKGNTP